MAATHFLVDDTLREFEDSFLLRQFQKCFEGLVLRGLFFEQFVQAVIPQIVSSFDFWDLVDLPINLPSLFFAGSFLARRLILKLLVK